jgi:hypothetical protein
MSMKGLHKAAVVSLTLRRLFLVFGSPGTKMPPVQARARLYTEHAALSMFSSD